MGIIGPSLIHTVLYWAPASTNKFVEADFFDPVEVKCRIEPKSEKIIGAEGSEIISSAVIYAETELVKGGYLKEGTLDEYQDSSSEYDDTDPEDITDAYLIQAVKRNDGLSSQADRFWKYWI